jgi:predicted aspartyl protease
MKNLLPGMLAVISYGLIPGSLMGAEKPVPFKLYRGYTIVAEGAIAGLKKQNLLIDTGAVPSIVAARVAQKLGLAGDAEQISLFNGNIQGRRVLLSDLALGPVRAVGLSVLVQDLSVIEKELGTRIDAIVGLDVLGSQPFTVDYEKRKIFFGKTNRTGSQSAFEKELPYLTLQIEVEGRALRLMVDTGAKDLVLFENRVQDRLPPYSVEREKVSANIAGRVRLRQVQLGSTHVGGLAFPSVTAFLMEAPAVPVPDLDGLLGVVSLGFHRVTFDYPRQMVSWR